MVCHSFSVPGLLRITIFAHVVKSYLKKKDVFIKHVNGHPIDDISACKKYGNILLIAGMGHLEINITKGILNYCGKLC